jgi:hypothetical protein
MHVWMSAVALAIFLINPFPEFGQAPHSMSAAEIFQKVEQENLRRAALLRSYSSVRHYAVTQAGKVSDAEMVVAFHFDAPTEKTFNVLSEKGVGGMHKRVISSVMAAELEAAAGRKKADSSISPANYDVVWIGEEPLRGRDSYVLELKPKRQQKFLFRGKVWIDQQDFAIAKLDLAPVKNPSFWVTRVHIVREYQRVRGFWIPRSDETFGHVRLKGDYALRISHTDYKVNGEDFISQK